MRGRALNASQAVARFAIDGRLRAINVITRGNVNDTYEAVFEAPGGTRRVIVQRINHTVFPNPEWIMRNMRVITDHVRHKVKNEPECQGRDWRFPEVVAARDGGDFVQDEEGEFWRVLTRVERAATLDRVRDAGHARECGTVLGCFHRLISDIDPAGLHDTLPGFHVCPGYLAR